jgi:Fic family protein
VLLLRWNQQAEVEPEQCHPLLRIAAFVVRFLAIHPFQDGNGRFFRALIPLALFISQLVDRQSRVSVTSIVAATGASRNTVKATDTRLVNEGLLVRHGTGRSMHYTRR